jgi:hypothetical protein
MILYVFVIVDKTVKFEINNMKNMKKIISIVLITLFITSCDKEKTIKDKILANPTSAMEISQTMYEGTVSIHSVQDKNTPKYAEVRGVFEHNKKRCLVGDLFVNNLQVHSIINTYESKYINPNFPFLKNEQVFDFFGKKINIKYTGQKESNYIEFNESIDVPKMIKITSIMDESFYSIEANSSLKINWEPESNKSTYMAYKIQDNLFNNATIKIIEDNGSLVIPNSILRKYNGAAFFVTLYRYSGNEFESGSKMVAISTQNTCNLGKFHFQ